MLRVRVDPTLTVERAEYIAAALLAHGDPKQTIELDFRELRNIAASAGPRLGNCLREVTRRGLRLTVVLPSSERWRSTLGGELLGQQLARHATTIRGSTADVSGDALRELLSAVSSSTDNLSHAHADVERSVVAASRTVAAFEQGIVEWSDSFPSRFTRPVARRAVPLAGALAEGCWNVLDHSGRQPLVPNAGVASQYSYKWVPMSELRLTPEGFSGGLDRLTEYLGSIVDSVEVSDRPQGFIQLQVVDDGVGIAARHALDPEIYDGGVEAELQAFEEALAAGGSVKLRSLDCVVEKTPGYGLTNVANALWKVRGFGMLRSGRVVGSYDGFGAPDDQRDFVFEAAVAARNRLVGTMLYMLAPVSDHGLFAELRTLDSQGSLF